MVERLHVSPNRVRGGGYLLPPLGTTEFMKEGCLLSVRYMPVLEETRSVFIMNQADDTNLVISTSNTGYEYQMLTLPDGTVWYPYFENVHFEVDAVLTDADDIPVSGKNVYMIGSHATVDYQVTDSNGECSFYFDMGSQVFSVQAQFLPDSPDSGYVDAISNIIKVQCGGCSIGLSAKQGTSTITTVGYKEAFSLEATVHDSIRDVDMNGVIVSFYNGSTLLGTATSNSNGVATLNNVKIITNEGITAKIGDETSEQLSLTVTRPIVTVTPDRTYSALYERINMTIKVVDGNGHNVSDEDVWWFATGESYHKLSSKTNSNGEINTGVIGTTPGTYTVYAGVDAEGLNVHSERVIVIYHDILHDSLSLSADKSVLSYYDEDSAVLTATLNGQNVSGRSVVFKQGDTVLSTVTTNSSGVATYTYNSQGVGDVTITAECMNLQETYVLEDCVYFNDGSSVNGLGVGSGVSCTSNGEYITITTSTSGEKKVAYNYNLNNSDNFIFECEIAKLGTLQSIAMYVKNSTTATGCWFNYGNSTGKFEVGCLGSALSNIDTGTLAVGDKIRIKQENGVITLYHNDAVIYSKTANLGSNFKIGHYTNNGRVQHIKNIKIKQL